MKLLYSPVFIVCCVLFIIHQLTQQILKIPIPLADNYLDNLLATPILLTLLVVERRIFFRRGSDYTLNVIEVIMGTVFIALAGELLFPLLSENFTSDWLDVLFYIIGSLLFHLTINKGGRDSA